MLKELIKSSFKSLVPHPTSRVTENYIHCKMIMRQSLAYVLELKENALKIEIKMKLNLI